MPCSWHPGGDLALEPDRGGEGVVEPVEDAHYPVAHGFDDAAAAVADRLPDEVEVPVDPTVGGGVADPFIQLRGAFEIAEQEGDMTDGEARRCVTAGAGWRIGLWESGANSHRRQAMLRTSSRPHEDAAKHPEAAAAFAACDAVKLCRCERFAAGLPDRLLNR